MIYLRGRAVMKFAFSLKSFTISNICLGHTQFEVVLPSPSEVEFQNLEKNATFFGKNPKSKKRQFIIIKIVLWYSVNSE